MTVLARLALRAFLETGCRLDCRPRSLPTASLIIPVHNRAELTLTCLQSLAMRQNTIPLEIIIVDNGSTDETRQLLRRVRGLRVIRNQTNLGFPKAVNQAAIQATGRFLILLNNDVQVLGRSIDHAVAFLMANADVGAVGGKVILLDGTLQEAGVLIGQDGRALPCGRGRSADDPAYSFQRDVDYCSGAFLATRRDLFLDCNGLDEIFGLGYYEETDFCARLLRSGKRVVFLPDVRIFHFENGTSSAFPDLLELLQRNHGIFVTRHASWLPTKSGPGWSPLALRTSTCQAFNILMAEHGATFVSNRANVQEWIARMETLDGFVTLVVVGVAPGALRAYLDGLPKTVEVLSLNPSEFRDLIAARGNFYDLFAMRDPALFDTLALSDYLRAKIAVIRDAHIEFVHPSSLRRIPMRRAS